MGVYETRGTLHIHPQIVGSLIVRTPNKGDVGLGV